jgi:hypothetical protein
MKYVDLKIDACFAVGFNNGHMICYQDDVYNSMAEAQAECGRHKF